MNNDVSLAQRWRATLSLDRLADEVIATDLLGYRGGVTRVTGTLIEGHLPGATIGGLCHIQGSSMAKPLMAEVVGFREDVVLFMPFGDPRGIGLGSSITPVASEFQVPVGKGLLGRVVDAFGQPLDGGPPIVPEALVPSAQPTINPLARERIHAPIDVGVRAINGLLTVGQGQRMGIFAGSGVGKSTLLGMIARYTKADIVVLGLVGERGREVREFIERDLGAEGLKKSVVVCVTADQPAVLRVKGAFVATTVAEHFCRQGYDVLLLVDSVTRFAMAQREIGLAAGEPPTTKGYTPSVFALLPNLFERAGNFEGSGSITGLYTVLVEGDDLNDPVVDASRAILDGHIVLTRKLAYQNHFPAIDVLASASRVMGEVVQRPHQGAAERLRELLARYRDAEDLIKIGAYKRGNSPAVDEALTHIDDIQAFLRQRVDEPCAMDATLARLKASTGLADQVGPRPEVRS